MYNFSFPGFHLRGDMYYGEIPPPHWLQQGWSSGGTQNVPQHPYMLGGAWHAWGVNLFFIQTRCSVEMLPKIYGQTHARN